MYGSAHMIHRRWVQSTGWIGCAGTDDGHEPDSGVHAYDRRLGFAVAQSEQDLLRRNEAVRNAERASRARNKQSSHAQIVQRFSYFERYMLEFHPAEPYTAWLRSLRLATTPTSVRIAFQSPPTLLVLAYMMFLRKKDPAQEAVDRKYNTVLAYINAISSVLHEFGVRGELTGEGADKRISDQLADYEGEDLEGGAPPFDVEQCMPKLWSAVWSLLGWSMLKRVCAWAMFLVAMCICARASCVTTYCPTMEDVLLPKSGHWDVDGLPKYISLVWRNWKSRPKKRATARDNAYPMKIHRNYLNPMFCPVLWLCIYLRYSGHTSGPLFQLGGKGVAVGVWIGMLNHWFEVAGMRTKGVPGVTPSSGASSHSIRRSAAQWAGRCGAREIDVRNAGRWQSMLILAKYMAQGHVARANYEDDEDHPQDDPIFRMWVFKKVAISSLSGLDML